MIDKVAKHSVTIDIFAIMIHSVSQPFTEELTNSCLEIIDELCQHPVSAIFMNPVDPEEDQVPNYLQIVKNPSDLGTVKQKLTEQKYKTLDEFKRDVNLIWENAALFNGRQATISQMGERLNRIFQRRMAQIEERPHDIWVSEYLKAQSTLVKLFRDQPKAMEEFNLSPELERLVPERRMEKSCLTPDDTRYFDNAFRFVEDPHHLTKLVHILSENEPSIDFSEEELQINLSALNQRTLRLLKGWVSELKDQSRKMTSSESAAPLIV